MFNLKGAPIRPLPANIENTVSAKIEAILGGKWTIEDVLEMGVDEMSTAASVGSGPDKALGQPYREPKLLKLKKKYEEYLSKVGQDPSKKALREFVYLTIPDAKDGLVEDLSKFLKGRG